MPAWDVRHAVELPVHPPEVFEIRVALFLLSVAAFGVTFLGVRRGPGSIWAYLTFDQSTLDDVFGSRVRSRSSFCD